MIFFFCYAQSTDDNDYSNEINSIQLTIFSEDENILAIHHHGNSNFSGVVYLCMCVYAYAVDVHITDVGRR